MATTLKRTSMALDEESLNTLTTLSSSQKISKAEVLRRAIRHYADHPELGKSNSKPAKMSPLEALEELRKSPPLTEKQGKVWMDEVRTEREAWRDPWEDYFENHHKD